MSEWKETSIGNLCTIKHGFAYKGEYITNEKSCNVLVTPGNFTLSGGFKMMDKPKYYKGPVEKEYILKEGDLIVTMTDLSKGIDTLGYSALVPKINGITFHHNQRIGLIENISEEVDKGFLYWTMRTRPYQRFVANSSSGTTVHHTSPNNISRYSFLLPPLAEQKNIASILSSLDDKIAVNRRICENLEAQAQTLFKHWFIDFTPFKDGQFVESELGMIPEGWRVGTLGDIAEFKRGKTITKSETKDGTTPVVAGGLEPAYYHSQSNTSSRVITISGSGANAGFIRMYYQPVWASDCSFLDNSSTALLHTAYCYLKTNKKKVDALQWGAAQPHVYAKDINKLPFVIPPLEILNQFELLITEMFDCIEVNDKENLRLASLRDTLLPKLMSGQIRI